eukprot:4299240-Amphidinium_carterae.1
MASLAHQAGWVAFHVAAVTSFGIGQWRQTLEAMLVASAMMGASLTLVLAYSFLILYLHAHHTYIKLVTRSKKRT